MTNPPSVVPPGWYEDPVHRHQYRWWDGQEWTPRVGDGQVEQLDPTGLAPTPGPVGAWAMQSGLPWGGAPSPPPRRRPLWPWILGIGLVALVLGFGGLVVMGIVVDQGLTHDLLDERFETGPGVFHVDETADFSFGVEAGRYVVASTTDEPGSPALSFGELARPAYVVDATATVEWRSGDESIGAVGLGCFDRSGDVGYVFAVTADLSEGFIVGYQDGQGQSPELDYVLAPEGTTEPVRDLRLVCRVTTPLGSDLEVVGYANGRQIASASVPSGSIGFESMGLLVVAADGRTEVAFDDASAIVPGE